MRRGVQNEGYRLCLAQQRRAVVERLFDKQPAIDQQLERLGGLALLPAEREVLDFEADGVLQVLVH